MAKAAGVPPLGKTDLFLEQNGERVFWDRERPDAENRPNHNRRLSNVQIGLIAIVLTFIGFYLAFTKSIPFAGHGYQLKAVFADAQNIRAKSPVRISGVEVGEVSDVQHLTDANGKGEDAAVVTMDLKDNALPIRQDATLQLRPRLFLEGNLFVDLHPGSPGAPELYSGSVIPENQTSSSVQFDQVLTSLQAPVRQDLQIFLKEFGGALDKYGGRQGLPGVLPDLAGGLRVHLPGEPGSARHPARRPGRLHLEPRRRRPGAQSEQRRSPGADQQPQHRQRRLCRSPGLPARGDHRAAARSPSGGRRSSTSTRTSRRCAPSLARLCPA